MLEIIKTVNLNFSYSKEKKDIENLNLEVPKGCIYGFLGPNGSGKTTTIRLLLGLLKKQTGEIIIFEKLIGSNRLEILNKIGALIEIPSLYNHLTAKENLKITANYRGNIINERIDEVLEIVKLSNEKNKKVKAFSLGMKQRLGIATALLNNPELLILDEPTNGLDPKGIIEVRKLIKEINENLGATIFISSHLLSEIEKTCSHVGILKNGKMIFQDTVDVLKKSQREKGNIILEIETDNAVLVKEILTALSLTVNVVETNLVNVKINDRNEISNIMDELRKKSVEVYQFKIKDSLEDLFLSLTEN